MKRNIFMTVVVTVMLSAPAFAATHPPEGAPMNKSAAKSGKSLRDVKDDLLGIGGTDVARSGKPVVKSGKPLTTVKNELRGIGGTDVAGSDKPVAKSGKSLTTVKNELRGIGGNN